MMKVLEKTKELKEALVRMYNKHEWNKHIEIDGEQYIYISCKNEFRRVVHQSGEDIAVLVGCMAFGQFMWCC